MEVSAAEIKQRKVFLHPMDNEDLVYCMKADMVDIVINPQKDIRDEDVQILKVKKLGEKEPKDKTAMAPEKAPKDKNAPAKERIPKENAGQRSAQTYSPRPISYYMPKMKTVSFTLYEDEYDSLMNGIKADGYRKTEFLLACVNTAKKNSLEATYRKYTAVHKDRRVSDRLVAKAAQEQDYLAFKEQQAAKTQELPS